MHQMPPRDRPTIHSICQDKTSTEEEQPLRSGMHMPSMICIPSITKKLLLLMKRLAAECIMQQ